MPSALLLRRAVDKHTVDRFFDLFVSIDKDGTSVIDLDEFYRFFQIDRSPFADRVFSIMGAWGQVRAGAQTRTGVDRPSPSRARAQTWTPPVSSPSASSVRLLLSPAARIAPHVSRSSAQSPPPFRPPFSATTVVCMWNYCSLDLRALVRFTFDLFDRDLSGFLDVSEVYELLAEVYGDSYEQNHRLKLLFEELDSNGDNKIAFDEFRNINQRYPSLLFPAFRMQRSLRERVFGASPSEKVLRSREPHEEKESRFPFAPSPTAQGRSSGTSS